MSVAALLHKPKSFSALCPHRGQSGCISIAVSELLMS